MNVWISPDERLDLAADQMVEERERGVERQQHGDDVVHHDRLRKADPAE